MARENPEGSPTPLVEYAYKLCADRLAAYTAAPHDAEEHANIEESVLAGGYAYRQVAELVQNAADAIAEHAGPTGQNRIEIIADRYGLWAANTGAPVDETGVRALLNAHSSNKRANQIGRFGLGFKSLLRLKGRIDVLSRSVCLHFDPATTRERIRSHLGLPDEAKAPGLRLAVPETWEAGLAKVEGAARFDWATTVVFAAIETGEARVAIYREIREFPEEFLLFLPCDVDLVLTVGDTIRSLRRRTDEDGCVVIEDVVDKTNTPQRWRIFETTASITDRTAIEDATTVHYREQVPVIWAAPVGPLQQSRLFKESRTGKFFAFFPTTTDSRTLGILNAPWKLNHDRTALVTPSAWNTALMEAAATLIADSISELGSVDDPGAVLDAFPRELQSSSDPAGPLVRALWGLLADASVVPNCDGEFTSGAVLSRHPTDSASIAAAWSALAPPEACEAHVHPTCLSTPARASRLNALSSRLKQDEGARPSLRKTPAFEWLEMTATTDEHSAIEVIELVDSFVRQEKGIWWDSARSRLPVILTSTGELDAAGNVVFGDHPEPPLRAVHPRLAADKAVKAILRETFHVRDKTEVKVIDHVDARVDAAQRSGDWEPVWALLRGLPFEESSKIVTRRPIRIRTLAGWGERGSVYRKGELITDRLIASIPREKTAEALALIVDESWHARDHALLDEMGIDPNPEPLWVEYRWPTIPESMAELWMEQWRQKWIESYYVRLHCRPSRDQLSPSRFEMPLGWEWLLLAEGEERLGISHWIMEAIEEADDDEFGPVRFHHSNRFAYEEIEYPHPLWSLLHERGALGQADADLPFSQLMIPGMVARAELVPSLSSWHLALEKLDRASAENSGMLEPETTWSEWLQYASRERCTAGDLEPLYEAAARDGATPQSVPSGTGPVPFDEVSVASTERDAAIAGKAGMVAVHLSPTASSCWLSAGAQSLNKLRRLGWDTSLGENLVTFVEIEPALSELIKPGKLPEACINLVSGLVQRLGGQNVATAWLLDDGSVYVDQTSFGQLGWSDKVRLLVEAGQAAGWLRPDHDVESVLQSGPVAKRHAVAAEPDLPARLLKATGGVETVLDLFEPEVRRSNLVDDPRRAASVALTLYGPSLLTRKVVREAMAMQGLDPPTSWSGIKAAEFVASIGFPPEYAVAPQRKLEPELLVQGPVPYRALHDFQTEVIEKLDGLIADDESRRRRAVISLPTGAGKTRVAAECCVTRILTGPGGRLVLWIAQSEELCEQAVQCFRELWSNLGLQDEPLRIVRFWGGQGNPKQSDHDVPTVVVATIQTLQSRMTNGDVSWISSPDFVVIDECHHALTPTYTGTFSWLNADRRDGREPPIIGLSATPFRGSSEDETRALARRFDGRLFPQQQANLFEQLQARGVLARFSYDRLEIEERLELSEDEQRSLEKFNKLPVAAMERLGQMQGRNARIVGEIKQAGEKSALVFATSVKHALRLAARLNLLGVKAAAVTGETDKNSRRWFIEAFRKGEIRVLCNHSALTTGFDAPATDLIVVARPVFSPSLYMQMVGRGLRGPVNGGKEQCRILTVQDNLDQYTGKLAHHFFERYYINN